MSGDIRSRFNQIVLIVPVLLVILFYVRYGYVPQQRYLLDRITKHNKLESSLHEDLSQNEKRLHELAKAQAAEQELTVALETVKRNRAVLVARRASKQEEVFRLTSPASAMAQALTILKRNALDCLDCSAIKSQTKQANDTHESLLPLATLLGGVPKAGVSRHEYRVELQGRFCDLQSGLHEIHDKLPDVVTLSIEMEISNVHTDQRKWILTLLI